MTTDTRTLINSLADLDETAETTSADLDTGMRFCMPNGHDMILSPEDAETMFAGGFGRPFWSDDGHGRLYVYVSRGPTVDGEQTHPCPYRAPRAHRSRHGAQSVTLARLIAMAGPGQIVRYRNGNRADLRRVNLQIVG